MSFCLIPKLADKLKTALTDGTIDPIKIVDMSSEERHKVFVDILGEKEGANTNALFESKLLLKNQQLGLVNWAKQALGMKPEIKRDIIARINKLDKAMSPEEEDKFLGDLVSQKLGTQVTYDQSSKIYDLHQVLKDAESKITPEMPNGSKERLDWGAAKIALNNYVNDIKLKNTALTFKDYAKNPYEAIQYISGAAKSIKASLDDSAIFTQGWKAMFTNPKIWAQNAVKTFGYIVDEFKGKNVMDGIKADIFSRENAMNGTYQRMKLDIGNGEEAFPSALGEKIPIFKAFYKASESAYNGFLMRLRADLADNLVKVAKDANVDIMDKVEAESMGKLINSLTGRGSLGAFEKVGKQVNTIFFSPKNFMSNIDVLTAHSFRKDVTPFVRKQAAANLAKVIAGSAAILGISNTLKPGSVDWDPRSSDFGSIKIGDTRFKVSGGMAPIITLAAREFTQSSKSSTSGNISQLGSGYGQTKGSDVFWSFFENKLSPIGGLVKDLMNQSDFSRKPLTFWGELSNFGTPLPVQNAVELMQNPNSANILVAMMADGLGIMTNTYSTPTKDWSTSTNKSILQFKDKVGADKFKAANGEYNQTLLEKQKTMKENESFKNADDATKKSLEDALKVDVQNKIFKKYNFKYKIDAADKKDAANLKKLKKQLY
jgi:hypothetical protein